MPETKVYNINRVSIILGGVPLDSGFGEDDVAEIEWEGPLYGDKSGADGEVCRFATNERRFTCKLHLMQNSAQNAVLSAFVIAGLLANDGSDVGAFMLKDNNGASVIAAGKCWVQGYPDGSSWGKEPKERVWPLRGVWDAVVVGGN
jgi:hypothetical protein